MDSEYALLRRIAGGDVRAFEELYRLYHSRLTRFLTNILRRPSLVEEVLDDTLMVVWKRADSFNGRSKVATWIFAIAYRKAFKALRRLDEPVEDTHAEARESLEPGPEQQLRRQQVQQVLLTAMKDLSADHRIVVELTYYHEMGYREIADITGCPVETVKTRMFYARRHLKNRLAGDFEDWL